MAGSIGYQIMLLVVVSGFDMAHMNVYYDPGYDRVYEYFPYCVDFLTGLYYKLSKKCCQHIEKLNILAEHRTGRRWICWCIQDMVKGLQPPVLASCIQALPIMCHTHLSFPISDSMDCTKYPHPPLLFYLPKIKEINKYYTTFFTMDINFVYSY